MAGSTLCFANFPLLQAVTQCSAQSRQRDSQAVRLSHIDSSALQMNATLADRKETTLLMMPSMVDMLPNG